MGVTFKNALYGKTNYDKNFGTVKYNRNTGELTEWADRRDMERETFVATEIAFIGDYVIGPDAYKENRKRSKERRKEFEEGRKELYRLMAEAEFIKKQLRNIRMDKKKDWELAAELNHRLEYIEWDIAKTKKYYGTQHISLYEEGGPIGFIKKIQDKITSIKEIIMKKFKKIKKKTKKFIKENTKSIRNIVIGIATGVIGFFIDSKLKAITS